MANQMTREEKKEARRQALLKVFEQGNPYKTCDSIYQQLPHDMRTGDKNGFYGPLKVYVEDGTLCTKAYRGRKRVYFLPSQEPPTKEQTPSVNSSFGTLYPRTTQRPSK